MRSYRNYSTIDVEEKEAAKEKNKEILSRLKEYFSPLAAKFNKKFLQGGPGGAVFSKSAPPGRRRQHG
ncbi:MAG: hypothetical protein PVH61_41105 [Candidatus Aminicenantes bacterium]|jgi:hypothetical protein